MTENELKAMSKVMRKVVNIRWAKTPKAERIKLAKRMAKARWGASKKKVAKKSA